MKQIAIRDLDDSVIHMLKKIAWTEGKSPDDVARRLLIEAIYSRFPALAEKRSAMAGNLSGGQQQILEMSMALLVVETM